MPNFVLLLGVVGTHFLIKKCWTLILLKHGAVWLLQNFAWKHCEDLSSTVENVCSSEKLISFQWNTHRKHCEHFLRFFFKQLQSQCNQSFTNQPRLLQSTVFPLPEGSNDRVQVIFFHGIAYDFFPPSCFWMRLWKFGTVHLLMLRWRENQSSGGRVDAHHHDHLTFWSVPLLCVVPYA